VPWRSPDVARGRDEPELSAQYQRAKSQWPFIHRTELARGLPRMLLFAVGSRETNLTNEVGDSGHGHGVWQLDDRSHMPPGGFAQFDGNVPLSDIYILSTPARAACATRA
jgi:hypothetical protein